MTSDPLEDEEDRRPLRARVMLTGVLVVLAIVFAALGSWQVQRLFWKLDLVARVDARLNTVPVSAPSVQQWQDINAHKDEYLRVAASGVFLPGKQVLVQAVTERGAGFWMLTPMLQRDNSIILINRGFVPSERRLDARRGDADAAGNGTVTGLLRMSEPDGAFLRSNDPANDRWYSRDVAAIAAAQGLSKVAPYFIDADATANPGGLPIGGLTVVKFRNSHLVYAVTWYVLAIMSATGICFLYRRRAA